MINRPARRAVTVAILALALGWSCQAAPSGNATLQREDLAVFERDFFAVDRSYSEPARAEARRRIEVLRANPGSVSDTRFVLELAQIAALADNGHTGMMDRGSLPATARIGLRLAPFGEDFYVVRALSDRTELLGGRLAAIDDVSIERLRESARTLRGGIASWRDRAAPVFFERPGELQALGLIRSASQAVYRFQLRDGTMRDAPQSAVADQVNGFGPAGGALDPADSGAGWRTLLRVDLAPWSLRDFSSPFRRRDAPDLDAIVIQLHANVDVGGESIAQFLEASDAERARAHRKNVVLDMRFNGGGNLQLTRPFVASLPSRVPADGRIVVLTSPWTFSAAISTVGYLKQAGGDRVVLVGEAPGDRLEFWAEGHPIRLPHSGAMLLPATERHDYATGCRAFTDCHPYVRGYPIAVKSLAPDVPAPWTIEAYAAGRDPGMEAVGRILRSQGPRVPGS